MMNNQFVIYTRCKQSIIFNPKLLACYKLFTSIYLINIALTSNSNKKTAYSQIRKGNFQVNYKLPDILKLKTHIFKLPKQTLKLATK